MFSDVLPSSEIVAPGANQKSSDGTPSNGLRAQEDIVHATRTWAESDIKNQLRKNHDNYASSTQKLNEQKSILDTHNFEADTAKNTECTTSQASHLEFSKQAGLCKTPSKATKIKDLSSSLLGQECAYAKYSTGKELGPQSGLVYDLVINGLGSNTQDEDLKRIAGVKHIVEAKVEHDTLKNTCTGNGKIKIRLGDGESLDQVKL